ncbi:unnamed protein product [Leuciscus chuanchicus]
MEQLCLLLEPLSKLTDALASETRVTLSAIKPVLDHMNSDVLVEKDTDTSLTKEMKKLKREDLKNRYSEKAKRVMNMACFTDPRFKRSSLDESEASKIETDCVQEAVKLAEQVRDEHTKHLHQQQDLHQQHQRGKQKRIHWCGGGAMHQSCLTLPASVHPSNQRAIRESVQCQRAYCLSSKSIT